MTLPTKTPLPQAAISWFAQQQRQDYAQYIAQLDAFVTSLGGGNFGTLINAANDAAAAAAGVAIGQAYRNGSVLMIRVT
jgi:hypothetical protein